MKHTKGDWKSIGLEIRHENTGLILANVYEHLPLNQPKDEAEANAKLIAAAPEMLEALKSALFGLELRAKREPNHQGLKSDIQQIKQAIEKATK